MTAPCWRRGAGSAQRMSSNANILNRNLPRNVTGSSTISASVPRRLGALPRPDKPARRREIPHLRTSSSEHEVGRAGLDHARPAAAVAGLIGDVVLGLGVHVVGVLLVS